MIRSRQLHSCERLRDRFVIVAIFSLFNFQTYAQSSAPSSPRPGSEDQTIFEATTELVILPVNVTDKNGNFVSGLTSQNFRVYDDGRLQKIKLFEREDLPVTVGLIVDHSGSMGRNLVEVRKAVGSFASSGNPADEMFVVDFNDGVWPELFGGQPFTSDVKVLENAMALVGAQGETALYDAVYEGLKRLLIGHHERKALIIVSDGGDNASRRKYGEVLALARQSQAVIYAIGLLTGYGEDNRKLIERLCKDTGGLVFFPQQVEAVGDVTKQIANDLRQQYTIGYSPEKNARTGTFRKIQVKVSAPGRRKMQVRTRRGYSPAAEKQSPIASKVPA